MIVDNRKYRKKVVLGYLSKLDTVVPFLAGTTLLLGRWLFGVESPTALFASLTCLLGSGGVLATRLLLGDSKVERAALEELRAEAARERQRHLDDLHSRLSADDDERTEALLTDLRVLMEAFRDNKKWSTRLNAGSAVELSSGVERLFEGCERSLEKTLDLWNTSRKVTTSAARKPILDQREKIIAEIGESIAQLSRILTEIQGYDAGREDGSELARIRGELDRCLDVAEKVEERMRAWDREFPAAE